MTPQRNRSLDVLRLIFATFVLLAHAPELTDGNRSRELFHRFSHSNMTLGNVGVDGFFLLSGYLIVQSWIRTPDLQDFFRKRLLRIVPGYVVAFVLSTIFAGLFASPSALAFFRGLGIPYVLSLLSLRAPQTPPVFSGLHYADVNDSLWTIAYEFRCYMLVALLGLCGLYRRRTFVAVIAGVVFAIATSATLQQQFAWHSLEHWVGEYDQTYRLVAIYLLGVCFYLFRDWIVFRRRYIALCMALPVYVALRRPDHLEPFLAMCGGYLLFYLAHASAHNRHLQFKFPDISYGIYLYGWPVESFWIWKVHGSPWVAFLGSTIICFALGWLSWTLVEQPALRWKSRPVSV